MKPEAKLKRVLGEGRFLVLRELEYDNGSGPRLWEACDRNGTGSAGFLLGPIVPDGGAAFDSKQNLTENRR